MRIWQIVQSHEEQAWPPVVGLYRVVVITLVYVRQNLNQAAVGDLFGISQSTVSRVYRGILPLVGQALCLRTPDLKEAIRGRLVLVDGTDVPAGSRAGHEDNFSGKRRRSGLNIQVTADTEGGLLGISTPVPGSMHDWKAFAESGWEDLLVGTSVIGDPAYRGTHAITPRKKAKGRRAFSARQGKQQIHLLTTLRRRAMHRAYEELEDARYRVSRTSLRASQCHPDHHVARILPARLVTGVNNARC